MQFFISETILQHKQNVHVTHYGLEYTTFMRELYLEMMFSAWPNQDSLLPLLVARKEAHTISLAGISEELNCHYNQDEWPYEPVCRVFVFKRSNRYVSATLWTTLSGT